MNIYIYIYTDPNGLSSSGILDSCGGGPAVATDSSPHRSSFQAGLRTSRGLPGSGRLCKVCTISLRIQSSQVWSGYDFILGIVVGIMGIYSIFGYLDPWGLGEPVKFYEVPTTQAL